MSGQIDVDAISSRLREPGGKVTLGIDGYVDEVWQVVESRTGIDEYSTFSEIRLFGERIAKCGKGGMANEIVQKRRVSGGFTANTGGALLGLGIETVMLAMFGKDMLDPVFEPFESKARIISVGDPAICHIFEFDDGKAMFPYNKSLLQLDWRYLTGVLSLDVLRKSIQRSDIIALGYWSNMPSFDELVMNIAENLLDKGVRQRMFFDFADIRKRNVCALENTLKVLAGLCDIIPVTLSLNENEAELIFSHFGENFPSEARQTAESAERVRRKASLDEIVVHTRYFAASASSVDGIAAAPQVYRKNPVRTAGAGDTFNGGYIAAYVKKMPVCERLAVGNACAGLYVQNGYAPKQSEIVDELNTMTNGMCFYHER